MPYLPNLTQTQQQTLMTSTFLGLNRNEVTNDGEMADMENLTCDSYPVLASRKKRGYVERLINPGGILGKDVLCKVDDGRVYVGDHRVEGVQVSMAADMMPKQLVSMGAYLCIWPDKVYVNTADLSDAGRMDARWEQPDACTVQVMQCRLDGTAYSSDEIIVSDTAPEDPAGGQLWVDTSVGPHQLKQWASASNEWVQVATTYVRIQCTENYNIGQQFNVYDTVKLEGMEYNGDPDIGEQIEYLNSDAIIYARDEDYIVVAGIVDRAVTLTGKMTVRRDIPDMDYICENNNRLWGCFYGMRDGVVLNEIYASKLGDFRNWNSLMGLSTDSYTVSVGTDGKFTGACTLRGYPTFFKENCIHKIGGQTPSTFTMNTTMCRGVQEGSERSLQIVGEQLFYKGRTEVMMYDGSMPVSISSALGSAVYHDAVGGAFGNKYYLSMREGRKWHLYTYDLNKQLWMREDDLHAMCFTALDDELYAIDADTRQLLAMRGSEGNLEPSIQWQAVFGVFGYQYEQQKYLSRFNLRMRCDPGTVVDLYIQYDSDGIWHRCGSIIGRNTNTFMVPVIPRRCDHCQIKLVGTGDARVFSLARVLEVGSDGA
ncbi:MAG: hypothetical protein MJZ81_07915 [Bacteroidales bacterium]|nr:hypothetical protein [Bacteroidales bacterium]